MDRTLPFPPMGNVHKFCIFISNGKQTKFDFEKNKMEPPFQF